MKWIIKIIVLVNLMYSPMTLSDYVSGQYGDNAGEIDFYFDGDLTVNIYIQDKKITTGYSVKNGSIRIGFFKTLFDLDVKEDGEKLAQKNSSGLLVRLSPQVADDYNRYAGAAAKLADYYCINNIDNFEKLKNRIESDNKLIEPEGKGGSYKYKYRGIAYNIKIYGDNAESLICSVEAFIKADNSDVLFKVGNLDLILSDWYKPINLHKKSNKYFDIVNKSDAKEKLSYLYKEYSRSDKSDKYIALYYPVDIKEKSIFYIDVYKKEGDKE